MPADNEIKISVIVPVYNVADTLRECLDSVLSQTLRELEVVCVDDGSSDGSGDILAEYASADSRVRVLSQKNSGSGVARNLALDAARGEYFAFMDPDDYYPDDKALERLYNAARDTGCRIVGGGLRCVPENGARTEKIMAVWRNFGRIPSPGYHKYADWQAPWGFWSFIYDARTIRGNGVRFAVWRRFQDPPFFVRAMTASGGFHAIGECVYCYRVRETPINWTANGGRLAEERRNGYRETRDLAVRHGYRRLQFLMERWMGESRLTPFRRLLVNLTETGLSQALSPAECDVHDFFDSKRIQRHMDESLFFMLRRVFSSPPEEVKALESIVAERIYCAKKERRLGLRLFSFKRKALLAMMLARGLLQRHPHPIRALFTRLASKLSSGGLVINPEPVRPASEKEKTVSVIIPVFNGHDSLVRLCSTLFDHTSDRHSIVFVDDASTDVRIREKLDALAASHANVTVLRNEKNLGFSGSVNRGAETAKGDFVILNTDTEVPPEWIPRLFAPIWSFPGTASSMPLTNEWNGNRETNPGVISMADLKRAGVAKADKAVARICPSVKFSAVRNSLGFCMAISGEAWRRVGPLAADVFGAGYGEETDWCARAALRFGYRHRLAQNVLVAHWHCGSFTSGQRANLMVRNRERFRSRNPSFFVETDARFSRNLCASIAAAKKVLQESGVCHE